MNITGVPLSPLPLVKSHSEPIRSVSRLGVVPCVIIFPFNSASFFLISYLMASFNSSPSRLLYLLSDTYFNLISLGVPSKPLV